MFDIIGDTHGHADDLVELLQHLGYKEIVDRGFCHENFKVIFLGDFIDRGKQHKRLLDIVMTMIKNNNAYAVMGNHEFNALAYHTMHEGKYLREHTKEKNKQHQEFLDEYKDAPELMHEALEFFKSLPLWLELDGLRIIHACWDDEHIEYLRKRSPNRLLTNDLLIEASRKGTTSYKAIEIILKGVEVDLPDGNSIRDENGHKRTRVRVQWWNEGDNNLGENVLPFGLNIGTAKDKPVPDFVSRYKYPIDKPPCFIGHYWLKEGDPMPLKDNIACLDFSVANGGKLVAYRWRGEQSLVERNFFHAI